MSNGRLGSVQFIKAFGLTSEVGANNHGSIGVKRKGRRREGDKKRGIGGGGVVKVKIPSSPFSFYLSILRLK